MKRTSTMPTPVQVQARSRKPFLLLASLLFALMAVGMAPKADAACGDSEKAKADVHVGQGRASKTCSGFVVGSSCNPSGWTYTTTGGDPISSPNANTELFKGPDDNWYISPKDCGTADGDTDGDTDGDADGDTDGSADGDDDTSGTTNITVEAIKTGENGIVRGVSGYGFSTADFDLNITYTAFSAPIAPNTNVRVQVLPNTGYTHQITGCTAGTWMNDSLGNETIYSFNPTADCTLSINFVLNSSGGTTTGGGAGLTGQGVRPNIMLMMSDSFLMNSEVLYSNSSAKIDFDNTSRTGEFFVNRRLIVRTDGTTGYIEAPPYDETPTSGYGFIGLGKKGTDPTYNKLAFDPNQIYQPWPGYQSRDLSKCSYLTPKAGGIGESSDNESYCAKYFPEHNNTLTGNASGCRSLGDSVATGTKGNVADADYCAPRDCNADGCREIVEINPDRKYWRIGLPWDDGYNGCFQLYTGPTSSMSEKAHCVPEDYYDKIWGIETCGKPLPYGSLPTACDKIASNVNYEAVIDTTHHLVGPFGCKINVYQAPTCVTFNTGINWTDGILTWKDSPFLMTCDMQFVQQNGWPCSGNFLNYQQEYVTNLIPANEILNHYYTKSDGTIGFVRNLDATGRNNYANWFTYYRTRGHVQKAAMLKAAYEARDNDRIGVFNGATLAKEIARVDSDRADLMSTIATQRAPFNQTQNALLTTLNGTVAFLYTDNNRRLYDSFAVDTNDASANCRQNHAVIFATGLWNDSSAPGTADGSNAVLSGSNALSNVAAELALLDLSGDLVDKVPADTFSANSAQHVKTWVMQLDDLSFNSDISSYNYAATPGFTVPANTTVDNNKRQDMAFASNAGRGAFRWIASPGTALSAAADLIAAMAPATTGTMCPAYDDCVDDGTPPPGGTPLFQGRRVSWKELTPQ